jgi:hypothetical protein
MQRKANEDIDSTWHSSARGERAWKETTDRVASRNADARKAGRSEREQSEREREDTRRRAAAERDAKLRQRRLP